MGKITHFERISSGKTFDDIYKRADKVWHTPYFVVFFQRSADYRVGFVASKKIGKAVQRNRAKRLLRAHFIEAVLTIPKGRYVLVAKAPLLQESYETVHASFLHALKRCTSSRRSKTISEKKRNEC